jgi:DNA-binding IscR family transcriptional regulator
MIKEIKGMEYALEILRAFAANPGEHDSKFLAQLVQNGGMLDVSPSYLAKILPRMKKIGLLISSDAGYQLSKPIDQIKVSDVLDICPMPEISSPSYKLCERIKKAVSEMPIEELYEFK